MTTEVKHVSPALPATPWGLLPPSLRVLYISTPRRAGAWLTAAFASDSACNVTLEEANGAAAGLETMRERAFDAVLVSHDPGELDALELLDAMRASGGDEPLIVLGEASEQELSVPCYEAGADQYVCVNTATTRTLVWIVARAAERRRLIREHRRLTQSEERRLRRERGETEQLLTEQRDVIRGLESTRGDVTDEAGDEGPFERWSTLGPRDGKPVETVELGESIVNHYRELLRAHVIMGSGNLAAEMGKLAELLARSGISAPQTMQLHVQVLEDLVRGLGSRGARHVMTRADLLALEVMVHLAERYRTQGPRCTGEESPSRSSAG